MADPGNAKLKEWEAGQEEKNQKKAQQELVSKKKKREEAAQDIEKWYADRKAAMQVLKSRTRTRRGQKDEK